MFRRDGWGWVALLVVLVARLPAGGTFFVPGAYPTIEAAVAGVADGATIAVAPGVYTGIIEVEGRCLRIRGADGEDPPVIEGIRAWGGGELRLEGLVIGGPGPRYSTDAVYTRGVALVLEGCEVRGRLNARGGGVVVVEDCVFPRAGRPAGAATMREVAEVRLVGSLLEGADGYDGVCAGELAALPREGFAALEVIDCGEVLIEDCVLRGGDGGVLAEGSCPVELPLVAAGGAALRARGATAVRVAGGVFRRGAGKGGQRIDAEPGVTVTVVPVEAEATGWLLR